MLNIKGHKKVTTRTMLFIALSCASALASFGANANSPSPILKEGEIKKGESIIAKLLRLEQLTAQSPDLKTYKTLINKLYPELFIKASELADGDLKTDLTTAIFLYDEALQRYNEPGSTASFCREEARNVYLKLCADAQNDTIHNLLWAKARLHTAWAVAIVNYDRGIKDAATIARLEEVQRERANDLKLGEETIQMLQALEKEVCAYASLGEFEAHGKLAKVSFEQLSQDAAEALPRVDRILCSLPRSPLFYALSHARNSYMDGLFWWRKTYHKKEMVINVNSFREPDEMKSPDMDANVVNYTVAINWRKAVNHTREAMKIIEASRSSRN